MRRLLAVVKPVLTRLLALAVMVPLSAQVSGQQLSQANAALQAGEADKAIALLGSILQSGKDLAEAHNLKCRVMFTLEQWDGAAGECEKAVNLDGQNSAITCGSAAHWARRQTRLPS